MFIAAKKPITHIILVQSGQPRFIIYAFVPLLWGSRNPFLFRIGVSFFGAFWYKLVNSE